MEQKHEKEVKYPKITSTTPCNDDWFKGKSHKRIASRIADVILDGSHHGIIGIDGGWGSGKSNLVGMTEKIIAERTKDNKDSKYVFVTFDAWAHHTDYLRRSLLEEFVNELTIEKNLLSSKWNDSLDMVLARVKEVDMKQTVKLNEFVIGAGILSFLTPVIALIFNKPDFYYVMGAVYFLLIVGTTFNQILSMKKFGQRLTIANFWTDIRNLHVDAANILTKQGYSELNNKNRQTKTREIITEKEPTARQFRNWMSRIDQELKEKKTHVVFVIDNMDRLPIAKVKETWATIHAFFAECKYNNIKTIIPFDRSHIINAFKEENITEKVKREEQEQKTEVKSYGNDFINKTFYVVYRVSPPILSDWRDYFERIWKEAFGEKIYKDHDELLLVFEKLSKDFTPRSIIAFINECATLYSVLDEQIPSEYLGIYILGKEIINTNPDRELLDSSFLEGLTDRYKKDENLSRYLSAIHYQINTKDALDVVYLPKVKKALDEGNVAFIANMNNDRVLNSLLSDAIQDVENIDQAIEFMESVSKREKAAHFYKLDFLWRNLFERMQSSGYTVLNYDPHHATMLEFCPNKKKVVDYFIGHYLEMAKEWNVEDYVKGVKRFRELAKKETDDYLEKCNFESKESIFEDLLKIEGRDYADYGLTCNWSQFDAYLAKKDIAGFESVDFLSIVFPAQCLFNETRNRLLELASGSNDVKEHAVILKRLKEITERYKKIKDYDEKVTATDLGRFDKAYTDNKIFTLYKGLERNSDIFPDLMAMRIARGKAYNVGIPVAFDEDLANNDDIFVTRIVDVLFYYIDYGTFMFNVSDFTVNQLVMAIAKKITNHDTKREKVITHKVSLVVNIGKIIKASGVNAHDFLEQIEKCEGVIDYAQIKEWPTDLCTICKDMDLAIAKDINQHAIGFLQNIGTDKWQEELMKPGSLLNLWRVYKPLLSNQKDAAIIVLTNYAIGTGKKPDKQVMTEVLDEYGGEKHPLHDGFSDIYDNLVKKPTKENVAYFTSWLFKYRVIDSESSVAALYKTILLDDQAVVTELVKVGEALNDITLPSDFVEKMAQMAIGNRKGDDAFVGMCRGNKVIEDAMEKLLHPEDKEEEKN